MTWLSIWEWLGLPKHYVPLRASSKVHEELCVPLHYFKIIHRYLQCYSIVLPMSQPHKIPVV